ncbi:MAG: DinB family protein [Actinomycetota bacterium]|nr:DinB family protein [Actinomycetota bacterium]
MAAPSAATTTTRSVETASGSRYAPWARYQSPLEVQEPDRLRARPRPNVWSPLEYACHVRDVLKMQKERIQLALVEDEPAFAPMRREERVIEDRYNEQDPAEVAKELNDAASALAQTLETLDEEGWQRRGIYHWPTTQVRSVEWIGRHTLHEGRHHLWDIDRLLGATPSEQT